MKDKRLEQEFDEYFKGVSTPDNITADAKKYVRPKNSFMPKLLKFASVAASCILVVTLAVVFFANRQAATPPTADTSPPASDGANSSHSFYTDSELTAVNSDAYSLSENAHLKLIKMLAYSGNANVYDCVSYYSDEELVLFGAKVDMLYSLTRYETNVYIEFAPDKVYEPLKDYASGKSNTYRGAEYYVNETTADNGEPQFKLCVIYKGAKYYFNIISSDRQAYYKYLEFVVNNY